MNREEFLRQLEMLLTGISEEERADAMAFYHSYFEDAGEGNEASIIAELESPQKVADSIRKNLGMDGNGSYYNTFANRDAEYYKNVNSTIENLQGKSKDKEEGNHTTTIAAGVVIAVLTSPIWMSLLLAVFILIFSFVVILFAVAVSFAAAMSAIIITGFVLSGVGVGMLFSGEPVVGIGLIGGGLVVLAVGMLFVILVVWVFGWFLPWALKGIYLLCRKPFDKRKERVL